MPQLKLKTLSIDYIAKDKDTKYDFNDLLPSLAMDVLMRKLDLYNAKSDDGILKFEHVDGLIMPGLEHIDLEIPMDNLGCKILKTIGKTQRALKFVILARDMNGSSTDENEISIKMWEAVKEFSKALKSVVFFHYRIPSDFELFSYNWKTFLRESSQLEYLYIHIYNGHTNLSIWALKTLKRLKVLDTFDTVGPICCLANEDASVKFECLQNLSLLYRAQRYGDLHI